MIDGLIILNLGILNILKCLSLLNIFNKNEIRIKVTKETKLYISLMLEDKKLSK